MIVRCNHDGCDWERSSASDLAYLSFVFDHGPQEGHQSASVLDDRERQVRTAVADPVWANRKKPICRPWCTDKHVHVVELD